MDKRIIEIAAAAIRLSFEKTEKHMKSIPDIGAYYFWNPQRGGLSAIVAENGEKLSATSGVNYNKHLEAFKNGKRN